MKCGLSQRHSTGTIKQMPCIEPGTVQVTSSNMFKLLVLSCLLISCLADPFGIPSWIREVRHPLRGCAHGGEGWRACARVDRATLAPHARDCSAFFYCAGARPACRRCPAGLHFNPQLQVCDWPDNVDCTPHPPRPRPDTTPSPVTDDGSVTIIDVTTTEATTTFAPLSDTAETYATEALIDTTTITEAFTGTTTEALTETTTDAITTSH